MGADVDRMERALTNYYEALDDPARISEVETAEINVDIAFESYLCRCFFIFRGKSILPYSVDQNDFVNRALRKILNPKPSARWDPRRRRANTYYGRVCENVARDIARAVRATEKKERLHTVSVDQRTFNPEKVKKEEWEWDPEKAERMLSGSKRTGVNSAEEMAIRNLSGQDSDDERLDLLPAVFEMMGEKEQTAVKMDQAGSKLKEIAQAIGYRDPSGAKRFLDKTYEKLRDALEEMHYQKAQEEL
jgi:hypothetical protein